MANEVVEDENEGTILTFDDAENVSVEDIMYLLQGTGSNRDRKISLGALIAFLVANQKFTELKLVKDSSNDISIKWDEQNGEFVIWEQNNTNGHVVAVPKLHVHGTLEVEKDVTLKSDVFITKNLSVTLQTMLYQLVTMNNGAVVKKGLNSKDRSVFERINYGSDKSFFTVSSDAVISALLNDVTPDALLGDVITIYNSATGPITVTIGHKQGGHTDLYASVTISAECAVSFVFVKNQPTDYEWAPLGNTTVTWA